MAFEEVKQLAFNNLGLFAKHVVEGFITGMHKSPFHGFSVEFAEHRAYNTGESTRHIEWKLYAKTDKLYTKRYEEETNLRCHIIIDNSASMHYPKKLMPSLENLNKISFAAVATAALMELLKRQRDAVGLSIYSDEFDYFAPAKGSERHHRMILNRLINMLFDGSKKGTKTYSCLNLIAEKIHRRSLVILFTDMFQADHDTSLFDALRHLKYNKHDVILFHTYDSKTELNFDFDNSPKQFVDIETGEHINLFADTIKTQYQEAAQEYFNQLKLRCLQYKIDYVPVDINEGFEHILQTYLISRKQ
jgi:uncharacterized protein (DUF58 family)